MQSFRNLKVWEKAHVLTLDVYKASKSFPREELYGLTSQMRRAAISVGANIAEGSSRRGDVDFARFLQMPQARPANWNITSPCSGLGDVGSHGLSATFRWRRRGKANAGVPHAKAES